MTDPQTYFFRLAPHSQPTTSRTIYCSDTVEVLTRFKEPQTLTTEDLVLNWGKNGCLLPLPRSRFFSTKSAVFCEREREGSKDKL